MSCFHPLKAYRMPSGKLSFSPISDAKGYLMLPCGQCTGCRLERSRQWAMRCVHEARMHKQNCFLTLTYAPEHLPPFGDLYYPHFQLFMKRLRKRFSDIKIRFYMCGEYGETFRRPHYHACLFGLDFPDKVPYRKSKENVIYTSAMLNEIWSLGHCYIGDVTFESAGYVARYVMKKITGPDADRHYSVVSRETGEVHILTSEFTKMSLKPGIGATWFDKYASDVFPHDRVIIRNKAVSPPRHYYRLLKRVNRDLFDSLKRKHSIDNRKRILDNTAKRLAVKEVCADAMLSNLARDTF